MKKIVMIAIIVVVAVFVYDVCPKSGIKKVTPNTSKDSTKTEMKQNDSVIPAPFESSSVSFLSSKSNDQLKLNMLILKHNKEIRQRLMEIVNDLDPAAAAHPITDGEYQQLLSRVTLKTMPNMEQGIDGAIISNSNKGRYCNHWGPQPCPCGGWYEIDINHRFWNGKRN